jgi:hypothetical protein
MGDASVSIEAMHPCIVVAIASIGVAPMVCKNA